MYEAKTGHAAIAVNQKIFWAGGATTSYQGSYLTSSVVEIKDVVTGASTFDCITPKARFDVVSKNNTLVFFTGHNQSTQIDIFDTTSNTWSIGALPFSMIASAIICVNNTIYVAGGYRVWKLEF